jgi:hypothetical protein
VSYRKAMDAARRGQWSDAFRELKAALAHGHPDAQDCVNRMWCPRCRSAVPPPSAVSAIASDDSFWNGTCPRCKSDLMFMLVD